MVAWKYLINSVNKGISPQSNPLNDVVKHIIYDDK